MSSSPYAMLPRIAPYRRLRERDIDGVSTRKLRFAGDSPLEGWREMDFEPSVPRKFLWCLRLVERCRHKQDACGRSGSSGHCASASRNSGLTSSIVLMDGSRVHLWPTKTIWQ